jgi:hypothetical protein
LKEIIKEHFVTGSGTLLELKLSTLDDDASADAIEDLVAGGVSSTGLNFSSAPSTHLSSYASFICSKLTDDIIQHKIAKTNSAIVPSVEINFVNSYFIIFTPLWSLTLPKIIDIFTVALNKFMITH